jgi:hypothetical protein
VPRHQPNKGIVLSPGRIVLCDTYRHINLYHTVITALMKREPPATPISTNILDYPCTMSGFERESLAAEAKLKIKAVLTVRCPTCGASRGVLCRLGTGLLRKTSHRDRRLVAKENCPSNGLPPNSRKVRRRPLRDTTTIRSILLRTHCPFPLGVSWPSPRSLLFLRSFAARTRSTRP